MKFRKKPIVIEAEQFFKDKEPWPDGVKHSRLTGHSIDTFEGPLQVSEGDWIIAEVDGEKYPCRPSIFEKTYEAVPP